MSVSIEDNVKYSNSAAIRQEGESWNNVFSIELGSVAVHEVSCQDIRNKTDAQIHSVIRN
jgi:hypothetical protein